ncbi:MAG: radical SAM protein, partial [Acholeplasmataceae bacterium]|nr:radical SAM protein [Acholeplasmataceae bacterium]
YTKDKGDLFKRYGVNRVSLGVQTFHQELHHYLNRKHTNEQVYEAVRHLKKIGINNINIDLIYAIPGQTMTDLEMDLLAIDKLDINHVSCYSLILEDKTYFYHQYLRGNFKTVDQDVEANMFQIVMETLKKQGFEHYEISNYAKNKKFSMHNLIYWTLGEYIGCGLGAHGFIEGYRTYNHRALPTYEKAFMEKKIHQTPDVLLADELIFGLRKLEGVSLKMINEKYGVDLMETYPSLKEKMDLNLVKIENGMLKLTEKGLFLGNQVFMVFI